MLNKKPIPVPKLREMLSTVDSKTLQDFCTPRHHPVSAGPISAFSVDAACAPSRSPEAPCRIVPLPAVYPFRCLERNPDETGSSIVRRVAP